VVVIVVPLKVVRSWNCCTPRRAFGGIWETGKSVGTIILGGFEVAVVVVVGLKGLVKFTISIS
jgi:hypothetical protein